MEQKNMINSDCSRVVNREPGRSADALQSTDACEIKIWNLAIRINIQILNRYATHSSKVPLLQYYYFFPHFVQIVHFTFDSKSHAMHMTIWQ